MADYEHQKRVNETAYQLLTYRRNRDRVKGRGLKEEERQQLEKWGGVIREVYAQLKSAYPEKARAMIRLFGLYAPIPRHAGTKRRIVMLSADFCVSESTLYRWRADIIEMVMMRAILAGLLTLPERKLQATHTRMDSDLL